MKRSWSLLAIALVALFATATLAFGAMPTPPYDTNSECLQCHSVAQAGGVFSKVDFTGAVDYTRCAKCHWATIGFSYGFPHDKVLYVPNCTECHQSPNATAIWAGQTATPYGFFATAVSPAAPASTMHSVHVTGSWPGPQFGANYYCQSCHGAVGCDMCHNTPASHAGHVASATSDPGYVGATYNTSFGSASSPNTQYETNFFPTKVTCVASKCHSIDALKTGKPLPACLSCHAPKAQTHGYTVSKHSARDGATGGVSCSACHDLELGPEHAKVTSSSATSSCGACHPKPRDTLAPWDGTCETGGCHTSASTAPLHANAASSHRVIDSGQVCLGCHSGSDLASVHTSATASTGAKSCLVCHAAGVTPATNDCTVCHFAYAAHPYPAASHQSSWTLSNCSGAGCHITRDLLGVHTEKNPAFSCSTCHSSTNPKVVAALAAGLTGCGDCHDGVTQASGHDAQHWANPLLSDGSGPHYGYGTGSSSPTPTSDCMGCHTSNLMAEHLGQVDPATGNTVRDPRRDSGGAPLTCAACHSALAGSLVANAIATGQTSCDACHVVHKQIPATHTSTFETSPSVPCGPCHSSQIEFSHDGTYTVTTAGGKVLSGCEVCHGYYEGARGVQVQAAISVTNDTKCTACHAVTHPDKGGHSATSAASLGCGSCHAKGQSAINVRTLHPTCAICHENPSRVPDITKKTAECSSCHSSVGGDYHLGLPAKHVYSAMPVTCTSASCHSNMLPEAHQAYLSRYPQYATTCDLCHANVVPGRIPANASAACESCHASIHPNMDHVAHASQACVACHETGDVTLLHKKNGQPDCDLCHSNPTRVPTLPTTTDCVNCHAGVSPADPRHYNATRHATSDGAEFGLACSTCHKLGMQPEHTKASSGTVTCVSCHETKVDSFTGAWSKTCATCHSARHTQTAVRHSSTTTACSGTGCHSIGDVGTLHSTATTTVAGITYTSCRVCHRNSDSVPTSTTCTVCHAGHGDLTVAHTAPGSSACTACHETADVRTLHAGSSMGACAVCHSNPSRVPTLPSTTGCVNCHAGVSPADPKHYRAVAHTATDGTEGGYACSACHSLEMKSEHSKTTVSPTVSCVSCHEAKVDALNGAWNKTCVACHATKHTAMAAKHASSSTACAGAGAGVGAGCHIVTDVAALHSTSAAKCGACHGVGKTPSTDCSTTSCHPSVTGNHEAQHGTTGIVDAGCYGCHFRSLTAEHSALGLKCSACHDSTNTSVQAAIARGDRACAACHPAVNGKNYHQPQNENEFTAGNSSMHRVSSSLPGMRSSFKVGTTTYTWTLPGVSSFLKTGWATDSIVTCDKCHAYTGTGPHGASAKVNIDPAYAGNYQTAYLGDSNITPSNVICAKCHTNLSNSNKVHSEGDHHGSSDGKCILCHSKVPHGWRLPRLLAYTNDPVAYSSTGLTGIRLANHTPSGWSENDCATSCGEHSSSMSGRWPSTINTVGMLKGTVKSSAGVALAGATVTTDKGQSATTNALGAYDLGSLPTGTYQVTATFAGYASQTKTATLISNQATAADFALVAIRPGTLAGTVTAASTAAGLSGVSVQVTGGGSATTAANGSYTLSLSPGTYTITYGMAGYVSQSKSVVITSSTTVTQNVALVAAVASTNLSQGKSATSSSTYGSTYAASKAFDGSTSTYWRSSGHDTEWLRVDLGTSQSFKKFVMDWNGSYYARTYRIETSTDGSTWTSRYSTSSGAGDSTVTLTSAVTARYVRLYCTSANSSNYQVGEFQVWSQ